MSIEAPEDPYGLSRFLDAQKESYATAVSELRLGKKSTHWIWYVFPQVDGLGFSETTKHYSIKSLAEARAYVEHPILGARLKECVGILLSTQGLDAEEIFGEVDTLKLRSCMTLFDFAAPNEDVFSSALERYFQGLRDETTLKILRRGPR
jgi:uncharacterized protein (DUF1810 family)